MPNLGVPGVGLRALGLALGGPEDGELPREVLEVERLPLIGEEHVHDPLAHRVQGDLRKAGGK